MRPLCKNKSFRAEWLELECVPWDDLSENCVMSVDFILAFQSKINFEQLSKNSFGISKGMLKKKKLMFGTLHEKFGLNSDISRLIMTKYMEF